jgi:hypothetical protein
MTTTRGAARHGLARAAGIAEGAGCWCACCGASPFDRAGPLGKSLGAGFSDYALLEAPGAPDLCAGCQRLLGGRPGDTPPPLRTRSVAVIDGALALPDYVAMWALLTDPPSGLALLSWATSKQRHHWLSAEPSTPTHLRVGSDTGTIDLRPARERALVAALLTLRRADAKGHAWCSRDAILSGHYSAPAVARAAQAWADAEAVVAPHRGSPLLALLVAHAPALPAATPDPDPTMLDPTDQLAADLLGHLARDSGYRVNHGKEFWGGVFARRVQRHAWRPLPTFVARMLADLEVAPHAPGAQAALGVVRDLPDGEARAVMRALGERSPLLVALAYDAHVRARDAAKPARRATPEPVAASLTSPNASLDL